MNINLKDMNFIKFNNQVMNWVKFNGQLVYEAFKKLLVSGIPPLILLKSKGAELIDYKIEGNSIQNGIPTPENPIEIESVGERTVNIIKPYYNNLPYTVTRYGVTAVYNEDGTIELSGSSTASNDALDFEIYINKRMPVGAYSVSGCPNGSTNRNFRIFGQYYENDVLIAKYINEEGTGTTFNISEGQGILFRIRLSREFQNIEKLVFKPQIQEGSVITEYEPYGYKLPIKTRGKNIMPLDSYSNTSVWATKIISMSELLKDVKPGKQYTISGDFICESVPNGVDSTTIGFQFVKKNATSTIALTNAYRISLGEKVHISKSFTLPEDTDIDSYYGLYAYMNYSSTAKAGCSGRIENIQIEEGSRETEYVPYIEPIINNIYLKEPLRKIGDYADYIDFENQIVKRNIYQCKLIDVLPGNSGAQYASGYCRRQGGLNPRPNYDVAPISNCLVGYSGVIQAKANAITFASTYSNAYVYFKASELGLEPVTSTTSSTVIGTAINNYITEHDMDLTYVLSEATEEEIQLPNIPTHSGTTIIEIDTSIQPSNMEVAYLGKE